MNIYFIGQRGSDAGGWYIGPDGKIHRIPGWNPEAMVELTLRSTSSAKRGNSRRRG